MASRNVFPEPLSSTIKTPLSQRHIVDARHPCRRVRKE